MMLRRAGCPRTRQAIMFKFNKMTLFHRIFTRRDFNPEKGQRIAPMETCGNS
jgi:hypothetical protein